MTPAPALQTSHRNRLGLSARVCMRNLQALGAMVEPQSGAGGVSGSSDVLTARGPASAAVTCTIGLNPWPEQPSSVEIAVQALSGMMALHGRDASIPRRLGLEVASVAAGIIASQGILAALVANSRGLHVREVETSVLQAGLQFISHHVAMATCDEALVFEPPASASGPPFHTADGHWLELEVLTFPAWVELWTQLGIDRGVAETAWSSFVYRYLTSRCTLPVDLHCAVGERTLSAFIAVARACGAAVRRVRSYREVIDELRWLQEGGREQPPAPPWRMIPFSSGQRRLPGLTSDAEAPLAGLQVVEVGSRLQGPLAGLLLQMLGADVLKVEPPGGDRGKFEPPLAGSRGAAYLAYNRGKRVVDIDYKNAESCRELARLAATSDVFFHNWPPGRAERLGLAPSTLARINPGLIYAHASGWGTADTSRSEIAGDYLVQAHSGCGAGLNPFDEPPFPSRLTLVDVLGGLITCEGILAGLYHRQRTGLGCEVRTSLLDAALLLQDHVMRGVVSGKETGRRQGRPIWSALDRPLRTSDGFLVMSLNGTRSWRDVAAVCGANTDADDEALEREIVARLVKRPTCAWVGLLGKVGIPAAAVNTDLSALADEPQVRPLLERVEQACWAPGPPWRFRC